MDEDSLKKKTQETAKKLFGKGIKRDPPYLLWKDFDKDLAKEFSKFITGRLYSRDVFTLPERQMVACAVLGTLRARDELRLHLNAALNVGCRPKEIAEVMFQTAVYGGMPATNQALKTLRSVLEEKGRWPLND